MQKNNIFSTGEIKMKKILLLNIILALGILSGCNNEKENYDPGDCHDNIIKFNIEPNKKALIMGDSITDDRVYEKAWPKWFAEETGIEVTNVAVSGSVYDLYRDNVDTLNLDDYDYFFLMGGTNNIHAGIPLSKSISDLEYVCEKLKGKKVVLISPFAWNSTVLMPAEDAIAFRKRIYENAIKYDFTFINASKFVYERQDSIHPTEVGCKNISDEMMKALNLK